MEEPEYNNCPFLPEGSYVGSWPEKDDATGSSPPSCDGMAKDAGLAFPQDSNHFHLRDDRSVLEGRQARGP